MMAMRGVGDDIFSSMLVQKVDVKMIIYAWSRTTGILLMMSREKEKTFYNPGWRFSYQTMVEE